jgi:exopolyphosphatase/guanosine-5'-triphosphate,3'-diphosphate pyrophosphatase
MFARLASNGPQFMAQIAARYDWIPWILRGEEEAHLAALGVLHDLDPVPKTGLIFDIGGRSTEFIHTLDKKLLSYQSLPFGVVGLTETYIHHDPPEEKELQNLSKAILNFLKEANFSKDFTTLIGTAGTVTTIAATLLKLDDYSPEKIQNSLLTKEQISALFEELKITLLDSRARPGLHPRRADVILAGLLIVLNCLDFFQKDTLVVSDSGLLEGLWLYTAGLVTIP